jgi:Protein of unknown function (DUF3176)
MAANDDTPAGESSPSHREAEAQKLLVHDSDAAASPPYQPAKKPDESIRQTAGSDGSESKGEPLEPSKGSSFLSLVYSRWLIELLASLVALLALAAIIITLVTHDGRPLPEWPFGISINALVSIFAVILKGTMMVPVAECE